MKKLVVLIMFSVVLAVPVLGYCNQGYGGNQPPVTQVSTVKQININNQVSIQKNNQDNQQINNNNYTVVNVGGYNSGCGLGDLGILNLVGVLSGTPAAVNTTTVNQSQVVIVN